MNAELRDWADLLFLVNQVFFVMTFAAVAVAAWRARRRPDLDVALLFGVLATLLVMPRIAEWAGAPVDARQSMVTPLVIAVPYLMFRLIADFATVPWVVMRIAEGAFIGEVAAFALVGQIPLPLVAIYAAVALAWSAVAFVREALHTVGLARRRYAAIAAGNIAAVTSLAVVAASVPLSGGELLPVAAVVLQVCVLAVGSAYIVGFAPPGLLRRMLRDPEMRSFLSRISTLLLADDVQGLCRDLARGARDTMGFDSAFVGLPTESGGFVLAGCGEEHELTAGRSVADAAMRSGRAIVSFDPIADFPDQAPFYRARNVRTVIAAPIRIGSEVVGALEAHSTHASLFASDDLEMCQLLADQAALVLRNRALLEERTHRTDHDQLTDLLNPGAMYVRIQDRIQADPNEPLALLMIELDDFDEVDQTFGHLIGDELSVQIARRLEALVPDGTELARWSRARFAMLVPSAGLSQAEVLASRLITAFERPFTVGHDEIECSLSVGLAVQPDHATSARGLVAAVEVALGLAKRATNTYAVYPVEARPHLGRRLALRADLRRAIAEGSVRVEYQPIVSMRSGALVRLEALTRWDHEGLGPIPPAEFVDLAERTGLIRALTDRVLHQALLDGREWRRWLPRLRISVNLSARTFGDSGLVDGIAKQLRLTGCAPDALSLEITESTLITEPERARQVISRLRDLGVTTEIDDFGTGYSSLAYLQHLPVSGVKIDRHFIAAMARDERSDAIVRATIRLSHELGFEVVAEGIEDRKLWDQLAASGCDAGQGFYIARPMPAGEVRGWLATWIARPPATPTGIQPPGAVAAAAPILVVDDDPAILSVVGDVLREHGHAVATAGDGEEALDIVAMRRPRAVLLDVHMPLLDGPGFAETLRGRGIDVPLVVMTTGANARRWAERVGADAYLAKPFSVDQLVSVMKTVAA